MLIGLGTIFTLETYISYIVLVEILYFLETFFLKIPVRDERDWKRFSIINFVSLFLVFEFNFIIFGPKIGLFAQ
jgi:hypothetical protein